MIDWRTARLLYLVPLLMMGVVAFAVWAHYSFPLYDFFEPGEVEPTVQPIEVVRGEGVPVYPIVNPVVRIEVPSQSVFVP